MKICRTCNKEKIDTDFAINKYGKDGRRNICKTCISNKTVKSGYKRNNNKKIPVRYRYGRGEARRKKREWSITVNDYQELIAKPCTYCGGKLAETGVGLDRIDSKQGYIPGNVNACCTTCNLMKNALSLEAFYAHIDKIYNHIKR